VIFIGFSVPSGDSNYLAIAIMLVGQICGASGYILEEKYLGDFDSMDPYMMAGIEGVWGTLLWLILLPILEHIPCNPAEGICTRNGTFEFSLNVFKEYSRNPMNILFSIIIVGFMPILYASALNITSYGSAAARTTVETARNFLIWGFFLFVPVYGRIIEVFSVL
jgi:hypothetical protein